MYLFYSNKVQDGLIILEAEEARHCSQVLRKQEGDLIYVVDGEGNFYDGYLSSISKRACIVKIVATRKKIKNRNFHLHIAIAPTKNISRLEWFLEKCTEIGIDEISLILCQNSERQKVRIDRLERIMIAAMKQSLKAKLPKINELMSFDKKIDSIQAEQLFIAHCRDAEKTHLKDSIDSAKSLCILIGPEGDFSKEEIEKATHKGFQAISLGESRLRTETAGIVACHIANLLNS